jgi:hypothetical protein
VWFTSIVDSDQPKFHIHHLRIADKLLQSWQLKLPGIEDYSAILNWCNGWVLDGQQRLEGIVPLYSPSRTDSIWRCVAPVEGSGFATAEKVASTLRADFTDITAAPLRFGNGDYIIDDGVARIDLTTGALVSSYVLPDICRRALGAEPLVLPAKKSVIVPWTWYSADKSIATFGIQQIDLETGLTIWNRSTQNEPVLLMARSGGERLVALGCRSNPGGLNVMKVVDIRSGASVYSHDPALKIQDEWVSLAFDWSGGAIYAISKSQLFRWQLPTTSIDPTLPGAFPDQSKR